MPAVTFACPECGKVLRSAKPIPAGKKITCPTCAAIFPMPEPDDEDTAAAVSEKPRRPAVPARDDDEDEEPRPRRKASRTIDDEDEAPRPGRKASRAADDGEDDEPRPRRRAREDDEDEEDDDRPRRKKARAKAKGRPRSGGRLGLLIGLGVVLLLLLAGGGIAGYFIWFHGINRGSGNEDPLAFVPAGSEVIAGVDYATALNDPALRTPFDRLLHDQGRAGDLFDKIKQESGLELQELFAQTVAVSNLDSWSTPALLGGGMRGGGGPPPPPVQRGPFVGPPGMAQGRASVLTLIARSSRPFDQKKVVKACKDATHKKSHGKSYYEVNEGEFRTLFMPSNRTLILSSLSAGDLDTLFASDGTTPSVSADTLALVRGADKATFWLAIPFEGKTRTRLDELLSTDPPPKELEPLVTPAARGKGVAIWYTTEANQLKIGVNVACADAAAAEQLAQTAAKTWDEQKPKLTALTLPLALAAPKTAKLVAELTGSLKFAADGALAKASASADRSSLTQAVDEFEAQNPQFGGGPGRGGPPNNPGRGGPPNQPNPGPGGGRGPGRGKK